MENHLADFIWRWIYSSHSLSGLILLCFRQKDALTPQPAPDLLDGIGGEMQVAILDNPLVSAILCGQGWQHFAASSIEIG